jgi:FHA domain
MSLLMKPLSAIFAELSRRKVLRVVAIYLAIFGGFVATVMSIAPAFAIPIGWFKWPVIVGAALIPVIAVLAWRYDVVPPQLIRDPKDVALKNPALGWATARHDAKDAGYILLTWVGEESRSSERRFFQPVSIGREPGNDIELSDARVSRFHAIIWAENNGWHIRDLDSANGTFIENSRVAGTAPLPAHCELRFHPNGPTVYVTVTRSPETLVS